MRVINLLGLMLTCSGLIYISFSRARLWLWARKRRHQHPKAVDVGFFLLILGLLLQIIANIGWFLDELVVQ